MTYDAGSRFKFKFPVWMPATTDRNQIIPSVQELDINSKHRCMHIVVVYFLVMSSTYETKSYICTELNVILFLSRIGSLD